MISVLIVDDEKLIRETLLNYVDWKSLGVDTIMSAVDGNQAWELIQAHQPDIVIADIKMPHMNGIQLAQAVRSQYPRIHFVILSGYADKEYLKEAIHLHVDAYIEKPLNLKELSSLVCSLAAECRNVKNSLEAVQLFFRGETEGSPLNDRIYVLPESLLSDFERSLKGNSKDGAVSIIQGLCTGFKNCEGTSLEYIRGIFFQISMRLKSAAEFNHSSLAIQETESFSQILFQADKLETLENELLRILSLLFAESEKIEIDPVKLVNEYLHKNYADNTLTIDRIAEDLNFNASYLCTIYKQGTGQTINRVLTDLRMQQACIYLKSSNLQFKKITSLVGYSNGKYFTKVFTKENGISPKDYRSLLSGVYATEGGLDAFASKGAAAAFAFNEILPGTIGGTVIQISLLFFALSTILGWSYYGEKCWGFITNDSKIVNWIYKIIFIIMCVMGATGSGTLMWDISDTLNGLMAIPNLIALLLLGKVVTDEVKAYFAEHPKDEK